MILRRSKRTEEPEIAKPRGFDDFELRLGDTMRGERATMGKSLLDVERELRIRAAYIAAIENSDPDAFETPGFIPGYVRSYARYLGMDPEEAFRDFCEESAFTTAHGMSNKASTIKKVGLEGRAQIRKDPIAAPSTPFAPAADSLLSRVEPAAFGSTLVLAALIAALGFGGWTVLNEVQRVQVAPVESTPNLLANLDPLENATVAQGETEVGNGFVEVASAEVDRLYRPEALDVPIMVARDAPISMLDPASVGTMRPALAENDAIAADPVAIAAAEPASPQVVADAREGVQVVAVRPAWVRVSAADGTVIFEGVMNAGDSYAVPDTENPATMKAGESGSVYFAVNGQHFGPVGERGSVTSNISLDGAVLAAIYDVADLTQDTDLAHYVAELQTTQSGQ
jgi:hypothetical protein